MEKKVLSCEFDMDTGCVEVKYDDGSRIAINCTRVENEVARNMYEVSELDWLIYNAPMDYANLLLHGNIRECLNNVTDYDSLSISKIGFRRVIFSAQLRLKAEHAKLDLSLLYKYDLFQLFVSPKMENGD